MIFALIPMAFAGELALKVETRELVVGQAVPVTVSVVNGRADGPPELPVGEGLLAQYQGQSQQHVIVNFEATRTTDFNYQLAATRPGTWLVGPVQLVVDGEPKTAGPIKIEVGEAPVSQGGEPVVATLSDPTPVLGQVVVYRFQFQYDKPLVNARWSRPEFPGFVEEVNSEAAQREYQLMQEGKPYTVQTIEVPLVAAGTGSQRIGPAGLTAQFRAETRRRRRRGIDELFGDSPFGLRGTTDTRTFATEAIEVDIAPLPLESQPVDFSGLVGQFRARLKVGAKTVKLGESVTLEYTLVGDGTLAGFNVPQPPTGSGFRTYDDAPEIKTKLRDGRFRSMLMVRRAVVPEKEGSLRIPPITVSAFDPQAETYVDVSTEPITLQVLPGEEGGGVVSSYAGGDGVDQREAVVSVGEDILPVSGGSSVGDRTLRGSAVVLAAIPVVPAVLWMVLGLLGWLRNRTPDPMVLIRAQLKSLPADQAERLGQLETAFRDTVAWRLGIANPAVDGAAVAELGEAAALIYADLERVRYGGGSASDLESRIRKFVSGVR